MTFRITDFIIDLEVRPLSLDQIREKAKQGAYRPVSNTTMRGYVDHGLPVRQGHQAEQGRTARQEGSMKVDLIIEPVSIAWLPVERVAEVQKDGRDVVLWAGFAAVGSWFAGGWVDAVGNALSGVTHCAGAEGPEL